MFGIGLPELILILGLALIVVGPDKLPELAKSIAKGVMELKKAAGTLKDSIREETEDKPWEKVRSIEYPGADNLPDSVPETNEPPDGPDKKAVTTVQDDSPQDEKRLLTSDLDKSEKNQDG
ncbi:MAG: twin-arginine translocase TatA/TatE family subunit [Thermodesulfobacteriota bacterium]|nr:twin-arginine translocase TatA/TatE family subunit [Thermodesulfobacteriota bacterium]